MDWQDEAIGYMKKADRKGQGYGLYDDIPKGGLWKRGKKSKPVLTRKDFKKGIKATKEGYQAAKKGYGKAKALWYKYKPKKKTIYD